MRGNGAFVELVYTLGAYYLYDVNTNTIHNISQDLYSLIKNNPYKNSSELAEIAGENINNEIDFLLSQGCLSENRPEKIEHIASKFIMSLTTQYLSNLMLQVTKMCNLKCRYCAFADETNLERNHSSKQMEWEIARKSIDFLYNNSSLSKNITIGFYGGEPLLNFDIIKKTINYAEQLFVGRDITYVMTTNLSVLTQEMIDFINRYNFRIAVSIDGPQKLNDKNRRFRNTGNGTHRTIINNLQRLKDSVLEYQDKITVSAVTDPEENFNEYIEYFDTDPLFENVAINFDRIDTSRLKHDLTEHPKYAVESNLAKLHQYLGFLCGDTISAKRPEKSVEEILSSYYYFMPKNKLNIKEHHRGPCVAGVRKLFVSTSGDFLPCEKVSEESDSMIIGNVYKGFDYEKIYKIMNIGQLTEEDCKNCTCIRHCSICAKDIDNIVDLSPEIKRNICKQKKSLLKKQIENNIIFKTVGLFNCIEK